MMNQLITVIEQDGRQAVSARELHEFLEVRKVFGAWIKQEIEKYGFSENDDYVSVWSDSKNGNAVKYEGSPQQMSARGYSCDYILSLDTAKELSMVQRTEKGKQARQYFIACEKQLRDTLMPPSHVIQDRIERAKAWIVEQEHMRALENEAKELSYALIEAKPKVTYYDLILRSTDLMTIRLIAQDYGISASKLNNILYENKVQYKDGKTWYLYSEYAGQGYVHTQSYPYTRPDGSTGAKVHMSWIQKGRLLIHDILTNLGHSVDAGVVVMKEV